MADNPTNWSAYTATKAALFATTDLKNIAAGAGELSTASAIDNTAGDTLASLELLIDLATAAATGGYVALWFIRALDGTNYESGADAVFPARPPDVMIPVRSTTDDSQVVTIPAIQWPQGLFKVLFQNNTGQTTTNTDSLTQVSYRSYNQVVVTA
jgi:hypothetical protein